MYAFEQEVKQAVLDGETVHYRVIPEYRGGRTVPYAFLMQAQGVTASGEIGIDQSDLVPNEVYSPVQGRSVNIGEVTENGIDVPTGVTP